MGPEPPPPVALAPSSSSTAAPLTAFYSEFICPVCICPYLEPCPASSQNPLMLVLIGQRHLQINQGGLWSLVEGGKTVLVLWMTETLQAKE